MTRLNEQIHTQLAQEAAFAYVADFANAMHWDPGVATSKRIDHGPAGAGTRFRLGVHLGGRVAPMEYRISVFEPPHRVVLIGDGSGVSAVDEIRFAPDGRGTTIDYVADIRLGGALRLLQPFLGRAFASLGHAAVAGMQRTLDGRAGVAGGQAGTGPE
jgi:carbon monoxide dehydrogenase subunit G